MSKKTLLVIGVASYRDEEIPRFEYADADARALAEAWSADEVHLLINEEAGKTSIESRLRKLNKQRAPDETFTLIYFGHAFSVDGENYLSCNDTLSDDLDFTSVPLGGLIERGGIDVLLMDFARFPLADALRQDEIPCAALLASSGEELSYVAPLFAHGIWAHHLLESLNQSHALSGADVQERLLNAVPVTLRNTFNDEALRVQTPVMLGDLADLELIRAGDEHATTPSAGALTHVVMSGVRAGKIKQLSGFNKQWHSLPDEINSKTSALIESIGSEEVDEWSAELFQQIKVAFKYKRREISCDSGDGCASIRSPDFDVDINIMIDPDDLSGYLIETAVRRFNSPAIVQSPAFGEVFANTFNLLRFDFSSTFDIEDIVDTIEDLEDEAVQVSYPPDCSSCAITTSTLAGEIRFEPGNFCIQLDRRGAPEELIGSFIAAQDLLGAERLLPSS